MVRSPIRYDHHGRANGHGVPKEELMELKITGLKIDTGEEASPKALAKAANLKSAKIIQEEDPEKKKRLEETAREEDAHTGG